MIYKQKGVFKAPFFVLCAERKTGWFGERDSRQFFRNLYFCVGKRYFLDTGKQIFYNINKYLLYF